MLNRLSTASTVKPARDRGFQPSTHVLRLAQEAAAAAVWEWDLRTGQVQLSAQNARLYGVEAPRGDPDAMISVEYDDIVSRFHPDDLERVRASRLEAARTNSDFNVEFRAKDPSDGSRWRWLQTYGRFVLDKKTGQPVRLVGLTMDVTERRAMEDALRVSEERLSLAFDSGNDGLWDWDLAKNEMWMSDRWLGTLGYDRSRIKVGSAFWDQLVHPDERALVAAAIEDHLSKKTPSVECEHRLVKSDGSELWVLTRGRVVDHGADGVAKRIVGTQFNISRRKAAEIRMQHMALHDTLTGLPNRALFRDRLEQAVAQASRGVAYAVLACDLDRFKSVNDTLGHAAGDTLLRVVADRMTSVIRPYDTVARLGGDEFGVLLVDLDCKATAQLLAERLIAAVSVPMELEKTMVEVGLSVGLVFHDAGDVGPDESFKRADIALYEAKASGRGTVAEFQRDAGTLVSTRGRLALDMKDALRRGDFSLDYQPVVDVVTGAVTSFEALLRWQHPVHGEIAPSEFIAVAEDSGLIVPLGNWALHEACREAANWPSQIRVAVNVSALQLRRDGLETTVVSALAAGGLPPSRLKLEVTESVLMRDADGILNRLRRLKSLGVRIALDDFGTGFSSLSYLRRFPFDKIKIDRDFVREIADPDAAAIIRAVVSIGERLGMGIVAEGVETQEQLELVRREGCTEVQGYLYGRPMSAHQVRRYLAIHKSQIA